MAKIYSLQYLRAIAALSVVIFHSLESSSYHFAVGKVGVDIFFVISGFIMGLLMATRERDPSLFLGRRIARIVPIYWLCTFAIIIFDLLKPGFFYQSDPTLKNIILSFLFIPHAAVTQHGAPIVGAGWTLEYEMFFYAMCVMTLMLPATKKVAFACITLWFLMSVGQVLSYIAPIWYATPALKVYTSPLLLEFIIGLTLADTWRTKRFSKNPMHGWLLLAIGCIWLFDYQLIDHKTDDYHIIILGIPAALIVTGSLILENAGKVPNFNFLTKTGDASYTLYLTHGFVLAPFLWEFGDHTLWLRPLVCVPCSIVLALLVYKYVERPMHDKVRTMIIKSDRPQLPQRVM